LQKASFLLFPNLSVEIVIESIIAQYSPIDLTRFGEYSPPIYMNRRFTLLQGLSPNRYFGTDIAIQ
jgi:hypothetical protein